MNRTISMLWAGWKRTYARRGRVARISLWLLAIFLVTLFAGALGIARTLSFVVMWFCGILLFPLLLILLYRWFTRTVLWKVRNRLILTYLLMGLAPVVLFGALGGIASYMMAGQYATDTALSALDQASATLKEDTSTEASLHLTEQALPSTAAKAPSFAGANASSAAFAILKANSWASLVAAGAKRTSEPSPLFNQPPPSWLSPPIRGMVASGGNIYLVSTMSAATRNGKVSVVGSVPLGPAELSRMAEGLGTIRLFGGFTALSKDSENTDSDERHGTHDGEIQEIAPVKGGNLPPPRVRFFDLPVFFSAPLHVRSWTTGEPVHVMLTVESRPTLLYAHLFATSVGSGTFVRWLLIGIAVFFTLIELLALLIAVKLSRTITRSISDLYRGTVAIDAGHLEHRIRVAAHDQLGALASSFNGMAASVSDLLLQQREKERLLNEIAIAQEVQTTLLPQSPLLLPGFEVHAASLAARIVGGDYFDFICKPVVSGHADVLCIALGDISGKGISAALLMASLSSAVRALSFSLEDASVTSHPSPAVLLKLLNRHLYDSTQSARYATLFLGFYNATSGELTYANGGHLPPFVLSSDGSVRRLDCGGSVVGLLETPLYSQETVQLARGDLLIAFTDGVTEPENQSEEFGEDRLLKFIREHQQEPLTTLVADTLDLLKEWIGDQEQPDDITLLLARQM